MIISVTERAEYKRCRRRWHLGSRNRLGMTTIVPPTALALGTFIHDGIGHWLVDQSKLPRVYFMEAAKAARDLAIETYRDQVGAPISPSEINAMDEAIAQGYCMADNYEKHWKSPLPEDFTVVAYEQRLCVPIPGTEHDEEWVWDEEQDKPVLKKCEGEDRWHYLEGRLDGIIKDKRSRLYVLEHKTYGARPRIETLYANDQFLAYTWMVKQVPFDGLPVAGVAYDGLWKRAAPPKMVDGRKGVLADLFLRKRLERSPEELEEFELELAMEALEMGNNPAIFKYRTSDGSCHWGCIFDKLCMAMSRGEDHEDLLARRFTKKAGDVVETVKEEA